MLPLLSAKDMEAKKNRLAQMQEEQSARVLRVKDLEADIHAGRQSQSRSLLSHPKWVFCLSA